MMKNFRVYGALTKEVSQREIKHTEIARRAAAEGIVLLKNDGILPLAAKKIALYGPGSRMTVKGGTGSGDVNERHSVTIEEGLKNCSFTFPTTLWMDRFELKYNADIVAWRSSVEESIKGYGPIRTMAMFIKISENPMPFPSCTPIIEDELTNETDTAVYVLSRQAGEGKDRRVEKGDYLLSDIEIDSLNLLSEHYKKLILVLNCGSVIDLSILDEVRIDAVLFFGQGGMEGGNALADILSGNVNPSGKLTDTWAKRYEDYPCHDTFSYRNGNLDEEDYKEGIYVGYRYFTTFDIKPRFAFGYGLSYTKFSYQNQKIIAKGTKVFISVDVENIGSKYSGKEIVQVYLQKPRQKFDCEKISLVTFAKTKLLANGEAETLTLEFDLKDFAVFDETSKSFVLEQGKYIVYLAKSSVDMNAFAALAIDKDIVVENVKAKLPTTARFKDIKFNGIFSSKNDLIELNITDISQQSDKQSKENFLSDKTQRVLSKIGTKEKIMLVTGGGYKISGFNNVMGAAGRTSTKLLNKGIPNIVLADGPAGLNVLQATTVLKNGSVRYPGGLPENWNWGWLKHFGFLVKAKKDQGRLVYRYMTAWPSGTIQAQSFDTSLLEEIGQAVGEEMLEIGVSVWLAPGINIHRNPLCGRNFEYYSEDPIVAGKMAAAITRGVQSKGGVGVSIKHFCCNNQEDNRTGVSENVSQRALREIYLKAFRIAIAEGQPWTVMSSYNKVNGQYVCNSKEFCTDVLRTEWGFKGLVMTDWNATDQCLYSMAINSGNDLIMPGVKKVRKKLTKALKKGELNKTALDTSATRVLEMIFASDSCRGFNL